MQLAVKYSPLSCLPFANAWPIGDITCNYKISHLPPAGQFVSFSAQVAD